MNDRKRQKFIEELSARISSAQHDINNPLSIIMGNAQLLAELAQAMNLGDDILQPAKDILDAGQRISDSLEEFDEIKEVIAAKTPENLKE